MQGFYAYIRVSTAKQGEHGVSLQEQRAAIERYAQTHTLPISAWFEERETAAKGGRRLFAAMLKQLGQGKARGIIIHKIDRSARNLKDWANLGELIDQGVDIHFVNESLDLRSRGGRLSADIQAVVASDYIRNLREETRKGFYGRLKQGFYPLAAPLGYRDQGGGKAKTVDPSTGLLVRRAFELYATGRFSLETLRAELHAVGLRNKAGQAISRNGMCRLLRNPFYMGVIRLSSSGESFTGIHDPLISKRLWDSVQDVMDGKTNGRLATHEFVYRRMLRCGLCSYSLVGERQKGHVYYRCHSRNCPTKCVRDDTVEYVIRERLLGLRFNDEELSYLRGRTEKLKGNELQRTRTSLTNLEQRLKQANGRLQRLTDAYLDGVIEKELFLERKSALIMDRRGIEESVGLIESGQSTGVIDRVKEFLELANTAHAIFVCAIQAEKRDLVQTLTSNRLVSPENVVVELSLPFSIFADRGVVTCGDPNRDTPRTTKVLDEMLAKVIGHLESGTASVDFKGLRGLGQSIDAQNIEEAA